MNGYTARIDYAEFRERTTDGNLGADVSANDVNGFVEIFVDPNWDRGAEETPPPEAIANLRLTPHEARELAAGLSRAAFELNAPK